MVIVAIAVALFLTLTLLIFGVYAMIYNGTQRLTQPLEKHIRQLQAENDKLSRVNKDTLRNAMYVQQRTAQLYGFVAWSQNQFEELGKRKQKLRSRFVSVHKANRKLRGAIREVERLVSQDADSDQIGRALINVCQHTHLDHDGIQRFCVVCGHNEDD